MKMVLAIINYDDSQDVISSLMKAGFSITKLATTGGFLKAGNVTILIGLDESKLDECFDIIREHSSSRKQIMPATCLTLILRPTLLHTQICRSWISGH